MKSVLFSTLKIIIYHLLLLLFGTVVGAVLYMVYSMCTTLVAGQGFAAFNLAFFIQGIFLTVPVVFALSSAFVSFYAIRHREITMIPMAIFAVVYMLAWFFIQPVFLHQGFVKAKRSSYVIEHNPLSTGYFRNETDRYVFYYSSVNEDGISSGVCIDKKTSGKRVYTFDETRHAMSDSAFTDSLIRTSIEMPPVTQFVIETVVSKYLGILTLESSSGILCWLLFSSLGLALACVVFLKDFSRWRLINVILIFSGTLLLISFNINVLSYGKLYFLTERISSIFTFVPEQSNFLVVIVNLLVAVGSVVLGTILSRINKDKSPVTGYGD